jgi:ferredoxin
VRVRKKARYVDESKCTGCGVCWTECLTRRIPHLKAIKKGEMRFGERRPGER